MAIYDFARKTVNHFSDNYLIRQLKRKIKKRIIGNQLQQEARNTKNSLGNYLAQIVPTKKSTQVIGKNWLVGYSGNQSSEHGEDGIIKKIFEIMPPKNKWVCEFGAHDPEIISNSWRLINKENWSAVLIEADDHLYEKLDTYYNAKKSSVTCLKKMVGYEGENKLDLILSSTAIPKDPDLMIIDIDGNDYHVWDKLNDYKPNIIIIEFNAAIPSDVSFVQERDMNVNQGSSLRAMTELAKTKGYKLIAATAWNAFFTKENNYHLFFDSEVTLDELYVYPAKHPIEMRLFQLYDGTLLIAKWDEMLWHSIDLEYQDYQVLPASYRVFQRELNNNNVSFKKSKAGNEITGPYSEYLKNIYSKPSNQLAKFSSNKFSQYGEDGMIEMLAKIISASNQYFVEVGGWDGITHSRTRNLTVNHHWNGLIIESNEDKFSELEKNYKSYANVSLVNKTLVTNGENTLTAILELNNVSEKFDFLFLNTYGTEYYLWESLTCFEPSVVVVQFNPTIHNDVKFIQENNNKIHQGCSLRALLELANYKGYELVGVTLETAFFIHRKYSYRFFELVQAPKGDLDDMFEPMLMRLYQLYDGTLRLEGLSKLLWSNIDIDHEKIQVVPKNLRKFHQFADKNNKRFFYRI